MTTATCQRRSVHRQSGFTLLELLVSMAVVSMLLGLVALNVRGVHNDAAAAGSVVASALLQARTQAISTTSAVRVRRTAPQTFVFETNERCSALTAWTTLESIAVPLPEGVSTRSSGTVPWQVCFTSRGDVPLLPSAALQLLDDQGRTRTIQVYLAGSVVVQ